MNDTRIEKFALTSTAIYWLRFGAATVRERLACAHYRAIKHLVCLLIALAPLAMVPPAFPQSTTAGVRLQAGIAKEDVDGDLKSAMQIYQKIADDRSAPRDVRSKALLRLAGCYEKLGGQARQVYEQLVRDFADQPAAAQARTRLAALRQAESAAAPAAMTQRKLELENDVFFSRQTDGQRQIYKDAATGAMMVSNLAGTDKRVIFKPKAGDQVVSCLGGCLPSRDFSMVFFNVARADGSLFTAVIKTDGTGYHEFKTPLPLNSCALSWSWDNRSIFACLKDPQGTLRLVRVSVADGELHYMWPTDGDMHLSSPDGRFIAIASREPTYLYGKIFVEPEQGGEPQLVADKGRLIDWTGDGRYLAIVSESSGTEALYLLPIQDGRQAGDPVLVRYGSFTQGQITSGGSLVYYSTPVGASHTAWLGTLNSGSRSVDWNPLGLTGSNPTGVSFGARWAPDSAQIVYSSSNAETGQNTGVVRLRNIATGEERELYRGPHAYCIWAAQHPNLFCVQLSPQRTGLEVFSISTDSGRVERLGALNGTFRFTPSILFSSEDDRAIYLLGEQLIRWDIGTQEATILDRIPGATMAPFPDAHWVARFGGVPAAASPGNPRFDPTQKHTIEIRPMAGGDWKPLISLMPTAWAFTPDGKWLLYHDVDAAGKQSLFRVSTAGGQPERIGDFPIAPRGGFMRISPDGQKLEVDVFVYPEMWLLENFEPKQQAAR